jgi:hypothetical protein
MVVGDKWPRLISSHIVVRADFRLERHFGVELLFTVQANLSSLRLSVWMCHRLGGVCLACVVRLAIMSPMFPFKYVR